MLETVLSLHQRIHTSSSSSRRINSRSEEGDGDEGSSSTSNKKNMARATKTKTKVTEAPSRIATRARSRAIPVPKQTKKQQQQQHQGAIPFASEPESAASSAGSAGSAAFVSAFLNPTASLLSHTPPASLASSYDQAHPKRARSGSVSGRLRSASEYLEEKGLLDRHTRGLLKDLIIIGDEELQDALDRYENDNDPTALEDMIQSGALQNRLPQDLDILGDLDLDFLTMDDNMMSMQGTVDSLSHDHHDDDDEDDYDDDDDDDEEMKPAAHDSHSATREEFLAGQQLRNLQHAHSSPNMVSPPEHYDGIGDLEFAGEFVSDHTSDYHGLVDAASAATTSLTSATHNFGGGGGGGKHDSVAAMHGSSPGDNSTMSEYERRMRSNSLFSALLNDKGLPPPHLQHASQNLDDGGGKQWLDRVPSSAAPAKNIDGTKKGNTKKGGIQIQKPKKEQKGRRGSAPTGNLAASLEAERKKREKVELREQKKKERAEKKKEKKKKDDDAAEHVHIAGSGRPRALSDPLLRVSTDEHGLQQVERPDGWIGAYSPSSRRVRLEKFMVKRNHRVWTKSVKYDVRKNFADSRLRVKGRFVKKEEESLMRELMSLT
jgi:CCT motif